MAEPKVMQEGGDWANAAQPGGVPKINSIFDFSAEALNQLKLWFEQQGLNIPITSIVGYGVSRSRVKVSNSTVQSIPDNTWTTVEFDTEVYDYPGPMHDVSVDNSRLYCRNAGEWMAHCYVNIQHSAVGYRGVRLSKNGTEQIGRSKFPPVTGFPEETSQQFCFEPITLSVGDYVELEVFQNSGGSLDLYNNDDLSFGMIRIS